MEQSYAHSYLWNISRSSISYLKKQFNLIWHQSRKSCVPQTLSIVLAFITNPEDEANVFSDFFNSIYTKFILSPQNSLPTPNRLLNMIDKCLAEVYKILTSFDITKSPSCDEICGFVLNHCATSLVGPITTLCHTSIQASTFHLDWKINKIHPVFKNKNPSEVLKYTSFHFCVFCLKN